MSFKKFIKILFDLTVFFIVSSLVIFIIGVLLTTAYCVHWSLALFFGWCLFIGIAYALTSGNDD